MLKKTTLFEGCRIVYSLIEIVEMLIMKNLLLFVLHPVEKIRELEKVLTKSPTKTLPLSYYGIICRHIKFGTIILSCAPKLYLDFYYNFILFVCIQISIHDKFLLFIC